MHWEMSQHVVWRHFGQRLMGIGDPLGKAQVVLKTFGQSSGDILGNAQSLETFMLGKGAVLEVLDGLIVSVFIQYSKGTV